MSRPTVLVVDDEPLVTDMLAMILDLGLNVEVIVTNSSLKAREILQEGRISLLLTDYFMPDLNGLSLVRGLREQGSTVPVILLTGYCDEPELATNTDVFQPFEIIVKPWNNEHLLQRINAQLRKSSTDSEPPK
ncbi:MAG TPA: response regulator [Candidatus Methylacidiphilales bacterium]|nr:response regulator [Candidatus Methylacidiphilales bacterium]